MGESDIIVTAFSYRRWSGESTRKTIAKQKRSPYNRPTGNGSPDNDGIAEGRISSVDALFCLWKEIIMAFTLPELPYKQDALEPYVSANTLSFHHGKHHNAYVTNLNKLIEGTKWEKASLEDIIHGTAKDPA